MQVNSKCYKNKTTSEVFKKQEDQKKHKDQQQVLGVEVGSFTPLRLELIGEWEISVSISWSILHIR